MMKVDVAKEMKHESRASVNGHTGVLYARTFDQNAHN